MLIGVPYSFTEPASQRPRKAQSDEIEIDEGQRCKEQSIETSSGQSTWKIESVLIEAKDL